MKRILFIALSALGFFGALGLATILSSIPTGNAARIAEANAQAEQARAFQEMARAIQTQAMMSTAMLAIALGFLLLLIAGGVLALFLMIQARVSGSPDDILAARPSYPALDANRGQVEILPVHQQDEVEDLIFRDWG